MLWRRRSRGSGVVCGVAVAVELGTLLANLPVALAWDKDGHEAIGMTTMSALDTSAVSQVKRLMHGRDAVDVAAWAHKVNKKYPWTTELHFQRQPRRPEPGCKGADLSQCVDNKCLVKALRHFYGRLTGEPHLVDINWGTGVKLTDADCVKFLINLIGDLHQPLHLGCGQDDMGRNRSVILRGKTVSLYELWDSQITQQVMKDSPGFWWGGWTHVQRTRAEYEKDSAEWKKDGILLFERWADETVKFGCDHVYNHPILGQPLFPDDQSSLVRIDEPLYEVWKRDMLSKMLVAGARTAIVLNSILEKRGADQLHAGSAVSDIEGEDDEQEPKIRVGAAKGHKADLHHQASNYRHMQGFEAGVINLGIFVVVLLVFLQVMGYWRGNDPVHLADRAKAGQGGKTI